MDLYSASNIIGWNKSNEMDRTCNTHEEYRKHTYMLYIIIILKIKRKHRWEDRIKFYRKVTVYGYNLDSTG